MKTKSLITNSSAQAEYEVKKSRFIGHIQPCASKEAAQGLLSELKLKHPAASHVAYAWRIRGGDGMITERFSDDGEPSGTAGRPILAPMKGQGQGQAIIQTIIAVVRYFGGTKLGTGGMRRAYAQAAKLAIEQAELIPWVETRVIQLNIDYSQLQLLEYQLEKCSGVIVDQQFTDGVQLIIELPDSDADVIVASFS